MTSRQDSLVGLAAFWYPDVHEVVSRHAGDVRQCPAPHG